jgi:hypothetical protein
MVDTGPRYRPFHHAERRDQALRRQHQGREQAARSNVRPDHSQCAMDSFDSRPLGVLDPALSGNIVSSIADGRVLNALGDQRGPNTLVGVYHMTWEPNSQWLFERVERTETSPPTT